MKSRISLTNWEMEDAPSMSWTNNAAAWKLNKKSTRFLELNLSLEKFAKRLIAESRRRKRSLIIPERTTNVPWTLWLHLLRVNNGLRVRPFVSRRNLNLISMSLRLPLTMPTRLMLRDKRLSRGIKDNSGRPSKALKTKLVAVKKSWKLLALLNVRLVLSVERLKSLVLFLNLLTEANANLTQNLLMLALPSLRCKSSMVRLCMTSVVLSL